MSLTAVEVFEAASTLPRQERAELAEKLVATLGTVDVAPQVRLAALRDAVDAAEASIAAGRCDHVTQDGLRDYLREIGREAKAIVNAQQA
jgi:hypothetical protein